MISKNICVKQPFYKNPIYKMSTHNKSTPNPIREKLLFKSVKRMSLDGLSNLDRLNVRIVKVELYALFTNLKIFVGKPRSDYYSIN